MPPLAKLIKSGENMTNGGESENWSGQEKAAALDFPQYIVQVTSASLRRSHKFIV